MVRSILLWMLGLFFLTGTALSAEPCSIEILDDENGWPVPLVELRTINNQRFISDNAGVIVIDAPDLLGVKTWFHLRGHGYSVAKDGFGYEGIRMTLQPGKRFTIKVKRKLPAKRLGRITGAGLFAESHKLGQMTDWKDQPVFGCDSVQNAIHENNFSGAGVTLFFPRIRLVDSIPLLQRHPSSHSEHSNLPFNFDTTIFLTAIRCRETLHRCLARDRHGLMAW